MAEVFYEKSTAEAMAHRVAEAVRRGSATNSESCIVLWPFDTMISMDGWKCFELIRQFLLQMSVAPIVWQPKGMVATKRTVAKAF